MKYGLAVDSLQAHRKQKVIVTPEDWIRKTRELGFDGILLSYHNLPPDKDEAAVKAFKALCDELGVAVEARIGREQIDKAIAEGRGETVFKTAKLVGTKVMASMLENCFVRTQGKWTEAQTEEHIKEVIASLKRIDRHAREFDLPVGFENHIDYRTDEIERIMNEVDSPYIGLVYDTANQFFLIEDPVELCRRLAPKVFAVHFKDGYVVDDPEGVKIVWCVPGEGIVDLKEAVSILDRAGRKPNLYLELIAAQTLVIAVNNDEYWKLNGIRRDENLPAMRMFREDVKKRHPLPPADPQELLKYETESLKKSLAWMKRTLANR